MSHYKIIPANRPAKTVIPELIDSDIRIYDHWYKVNCLDDRVAYMQIDDEITQKTLSYLQQKRNNLLTHNHHLAGDIRDEHSFNLMDIGMDVYQHLYKKIVSTIEFVGGDKVADISMTNPWVNWQKAGEYNPTHTHGGLLSVVWYLNVPSEIEKELLDQANNTSAASRGCITFYARRETDSMIFLPKKNDFFVFDAKHAHSVDPFYSTDEERVSVSFNIEGVTFSDATYIK